MNLLQINLENLWTILNQPLVLLLLGSTIGWLFLNFVWRPYQEKRGKRQLKENYRNEAYLRLMEMQNRFPTSSISPISHLISGFKAMNPDFKDWSLSALIYFGWTEYVYNEVYKELVDLGYLTDDVPNRIVLANDIIQRVRICLQKNEN